MGGAVGGCWALAVLAVRARSSAARGRFVFVGMLDDTDSIQRAGAGLGAQAPDISRVKLMLETGSGIVTWMHYPETVCE